jgi:hypothetical protein
MRHRLHLAFHVHTAFPEQVNAMQCQRLLWTPTDGFRFGRDGFRRTAHKLSDKNAVWSCQFVRVRFTPDQHDRLAVEASTTIFPSIVP